MNKERINSLVGKTETETLLALAQAGGYPIEYVLEMFKKEALSSLEI